MVILTIYAIKIYQAKSAYTLIELHEARPIRGWLILLGISTVMIPLGLFRRAVSSGFWDYPLWNDLSEKTVLVEISLKSMLFLHAIGFAALLCFSILGMLLFFNRRKSFPGIYIPFLFGYICFLILNCGIYLLIKHVTGGGIFWIEIMAILFFIAPSTCWILYLKKSVRVKETFVFPYSELEWRTAMIKHYNHQATATQQKEIIDNENI